MSLTNTTDSNEHREEIELARQTLVERADQHRSQTRVAHLAGAEALGDFLHVAGLGWFAWTGARFEPDLENKLITQSVVRSIRSLWPEALADKTFREDLTKCQSSGGLSGVVKIMTTFAALSCGQDELDSDPWLLNTANCVLDLRELQSGTDWRDLTPHAHEPRHLMTQVTRAAYVPDASSETWQTFLDTSLPDAEVREYLQRHIGLSLIGEQLEHRLAILTGAGRNGKGVLYSTVVHALGDYASVVNPALLNVDRNATADKPNPALLDLRGRRVVFGSETAKSAQIDAARLKALTGGDRIKARGVHGRVVVDFAPSHSLMMVTNHLPQLPADDPAVWERIIQIPFDVVVPPEQRDPYLETKLRDDADAVLAWALAGLQAYLRDGLRPPARVAEATEQYRDDQDTVARFLKDRCDVGCSAAESDTTKVLHIDYQKFCRANGVLHEHCLGERDFGHRLDALGHPAKKSNGRRARVGLRLLPEDGGTCHHDWHRGQRCDPHWCHAGHNGECNYQDESSSHAEVAEDGTGIDEDNTGPLGDKNPFGSPSDFR